MEKIICPKCKSKNVRKEMGITLALGIPQKWVCENCGYSSHLFPEIKLNKK